MTLPSPLPADSTTGSAFTAAQEDQVETDINEDTAAIAALQASEVQRVTILVTTALTLSAGTTVTLATGGTAVLAAICDVTAIIGTGGSLTLPTAVGNPNHYTAINASGGLVTVAAAVSGQLIIGSALPLTLPANATLGFVSDNTNYWGN